MKSIRSKTLLILSTAVIGLIALLAAASLFIVLDGFETLEADNVEQDLQRTRNTVLAELRSMESVNADWAFWTDTFDFMNGEYDEYVEANITADTLVNLETDVILFVDVSGDVLLGSAVDLESWEEIPVPEGLEAFLTQDGLLLYGEDATRDDGSSGIVLLPSGPMLISSRPVLTNEHEGPSPGSLIFARFVNEAKLEQWSDIVRLPLVAAQLDDAQFPADWQAARAALTTDAPVFAETLNGDTTAGYAYFEDIAGNPALILRADISRDIYQQGLSTVRFFMLSLVGVALVVGLLTILLLYNLVLSPVQNLEHSVSRISLDKGVSRRVSVTGEDEIASLGSSINAMLAKIEGTQKELTQVNTDLEAARAKAEQATRLKSQFLSTMSHELRTPLNAIIGYTDIQLAGMVGPINEEQMDYLQRVLANGEHLLQLINDVLDLSKIEAGRMDIQAKPFGLRDWIDGVVQLNRVLAEDKNLKLEVEVDEQLPNTIVGDAGRLKQIAINLLSNAIKFTDAGQVKIAVSANGQSTWQLAVSDTGAGIPPHLQEAIFEEFRQVDGAYDRKNGGTGLGLAIVSKLAQAMGGTVRVSSEVARGSTFTVTLPLIAVSETEQIQHGVN